MKPVYHVLVSAGTGFAFGFWLKSFPAGLACCLSGIFIDLDHCLDYYLNRREIPARWEKFWNFFVRAQMKKFYLIFHSYELILTLWFIAYMLHLNIVWLGVILGISIHVICDQIFNPFQPFAYFFTYRLKVRFDRNSIYTKEYLEKFS